MLTTPHVLTGIVIANKVKPLWLAMLASFASHQILDLIPHDDFDLLGDEKDGKSKVILFQDGKLNINWRTLVIFLDAAMAGSLAIYFGIKFHDPIRYLLCAGLSIWSDLIRSMIYFLNWKPKFVKSVDKLDSKFFHNNERSFWGKAVQIAIVVDMLAILFNTIDFPWM